MDNAGPFREALAEQAEAGTPVFGICLGMQMLLTSSEEADHAGEGEVEGLDFIPGRTSGSDATDGAAHGLERTRRDAGPSPRRGRRQRGVEDPTGRRNRSSVDGEYAYFVHSYYADPDDESATVATTDYGRVFAAVVANDAGNVFGTQFHPEKSGETGLRTCGTTSILSRPRVLDLGSFVCLQELLSCCSPAQRRVSERRRRGRSPTTAGPSTRRMFGPSFRGYPRALSLSRTRCN